MKLSGFLIVVKDIKKAENIITTSSVLKRSWITMAT